MKWKVLFLITFCSHWLFCQTPKFKELFTEKDRQYLITNMRECLGFTSDIKFSYSSDDLFGSKVVREKPASIAEIDKLKKQLKANDDDAYIYLDISGMYSRLNQNKDAIEYRNKAIEISEKLIAQYSDSANPYLFLAALYNGALQPEKTIYYNRIVSGINPRFIDPLLTNASIFLVYFKTDSAKVIINSVLKNYPADHRVYSLIPLLYLTSVFQKANNANDENYFKNTPIDSIITTPLLDEIYVNNKSDYDVEFLYRVSRQILISSVGGMISVSDTAFHGDNAKFNIPKELNKEIQANTAFFLECLKSKDVKYHFYANKLLGSIYLLNNETKKAIPYLRKVINLKPVSKCSSTNNTNEDYYNLLNAYLIIKDTASYEKTLLEKIKLQPTIDPFSRDYTNLAMLYSCKNKMDLARQYFQKAKEIDDKYLALMEVGERSNALVGLGFCDFVSNNLEGAMNYVNEAYKQNSKQWELYVLYTSVLIQQRDAINAYETIKALKRLHDREWVQEDYIDYFFEFK